MRPTSGSDDTVLIRRAGHAGRITLNRPRALNSLTHAMVRRIDEALTSWEHDDGVRLVLLDGAGDRGLCAGGDIRAIHDSAKAGDGAAAAFWRDEYRLNARIARYPKPYVALMDGIVMGGGVGLSAHGGVRVVTERSRVAMPETGIGFVPDVGGTYLLSRAPGELGTLLALTARAAGPGDAIACGLADHFVPSASLPALAEALTRTLPGEALPRFTTGAPEAELPRQRGWIDACCSGDDLTTIAERLDCHGSAEAKRAAAEIAEKSPTALHLTLAALRRAARLDSLEEVLDQEYRTSCATLGLPDLVEGIRARVVDKDRDPHWSPRDPGAVSPQLVESCLRPLGDGEELGLAR